jgi:hypothetical protein
MTSYTTPISGAHPARKYLCANDTDVEPRLMSDRGLVEAFGRVRSEYGMHSRRWGYDDLTNLGERAFHLQDEIARRLSERAA